MSFNELAKEIHQVAVDHGWWEEKRNKGEMIALMHSELSEALEFIRKPAQSDHIPEFSGVEEELADCIIRILDYAHSEGYDMDVVIRAKIEFNKSRPYKHGGKKF